MLTFNLKKKWFDRIKSGEKTHEYREVKDYWTNRLYNIDTAHCDYILLKHEFITFKCGYPKSDEEDKILKARIKQITIINGQDTDLKIDRPVYDIEFELIKSRLLSFIFLISFLIVVNTLSKFKRCSKEEFLDKFTELLEDNKNG